MSKCKKEKKWIFSEIIAVYDLNLIELIRYVSILGQGHLTLAQSHLHMKLYQTDSIIVLSNHWAIFSQSLNVSL